MLTIVDSPRFVAKNVSFLELRGLSYPEISMILVLIFRNVSQTIVVSATSLSLRFLRVVRCAEQLSARTTSINMTTDGLINNEELEVLMWIEGICAHNHQVLWDGCS